MSFRAEELVQHAPSTSWLQGGVVLELMQLGDLTKGSVSLERLKVGIEHARSVLLDPEEKRPVYARKQREQAAMLVLLDLLERARLEAKGKGASTFVWREDF